MISTSHIKTTSYLLLLALTISCTTKSAHISEMCMQTTDNPTIPQPALHSSQSDGVLHSPIVLPLPTPSTINHQLSTSTPLSLHAAIKLATECSQETIRLQSELEASSYNTSKDLRDPELRLSYGEDESTVNRHRWSTPDLSTTDGKVDNESSSYRVALRFFMPNIWTRSALELKNNAAYKALNAELATEKKRIASDTRLAYAEINYLTQKQNLAELLVKLHAKKQKQIEKLTKSGSLSTMDSIAFSRRYLQAASELTRIEIRRNKAFQSLAEILCISANNLEIDSDNNLLHIDTSDAGINELQALMMLNRTDLTGLGWRRIEAEAALKAHKRTRLPWLQHLQLSYGSGSGTSTGQDITTEIGGFTQNDFRDDSTDEEEWAITTAINIPLYGSANNELKILTTKLQQAEIEEQTEIKNAKIKLHDACLTVRKQNKMVKQYKNQTLPIIKSIKKALTNNKSSLSFEDQIKMYQDLAQAKQLIMELEFNYRSALIKLDKTLGLPLFHRQL